jgi:hypothetical protein
MTSEAADQEPVRLTRLIEAPRDQVRAWTDPEHLRRWWGPGAFTCPEAEVDLRPGGTYRLVMAWRSSKPCWLGASPMPEATNSIEIHRPPAEVFAFSATGSRRRSSPHGAGP